MTLSAGLHRSVPMADYIADTLCDQPSLSASGIRTLIEATPLEFASRNARLWPFPFEYRERGGTKGTTLGTAIHTILLGCGQSICVINPADYTTEKGEPGKNLATKGAKRAIAEAEANGLLILNPGENAAATRAARYAEEKIARNPNYSDAWARSESEVTLIWQRETACGPIWCRSRPDKLDIATGTMFDPKSTALSLSDHSLSRKFAGEGTDYQAVWAQIGLETIIPSLAGKSRFIPLGIEVAPPYDSRFVPFPKSTLELIAQEIDRACELFAKCLYANEWPGWPDGELPVVSWRENAIYQALSEAEDDANA